MKRKQLLLIILSLLCFNSIALSNSTFTETLFEKKDIAHINLLQQSLLFSHQIDDNQNSLKSLFALGKYFEYMDVFNKTYSALTEAENEDRYFYLVSNYYQKQYNELSLIIKSIEYDVLTPKQKANYSLILAVDLFLHKKYAELESLNVQVSKDDSFPEHVSKSIEKLRNILYLQLYKPAQFIHKDEDYYIVQAWNNVLTGDYKSAGLFYEKAGLSSSNTLIIYSNGMNELKTGNYKKARDFFLKMYDPSYDREKTFRIIESYFYDNNISVTVENINQFRSIYPKDNEYGEPLLIIEAMCNYISGNYELAQKQFSQIKSNNNAKFYLAEIYYAEKKYSQAQSTYESFINKSNVNSDLYQKAIYGLAWSQFKDGQYVAAKSNFSKLISIDNKNKDILLNSLVKIGDSSYNLHTYKDALKEYQFAVSKLLIQKDAYSQLYKTAIFNVARIYSKLREYQLSTEYLNQYLKQTDDPSDIFTAKTMQADNYMKLKQNDNAATVLQELILTYQPKNEDIYIILADTYYNLKQYQKAIDAYQDYLKIFENGNRVVDAKYGIVQSLFYLNDYEEALKVAKETDDMFQSQLYEEIQEKIKFEKEQEKNK